MVAVPAPLPSFTFEEYLRLDAVSDQRFEWVAGQVYAMAGGTDRHLATVQALFTRIAPLARAAGCRPWVADREWCAWASRMPTTSHRTTQPRSDDEAVTTAPRGGRGRRDRVR